MSSTKSISFQSKGRYAILGSLDKKTKLIVFIFHGQGQLAHFFIKKFAALQEQGITIIAPEGLHQYYLHGFSGRVGASWMTSENRLVAIQNYLSYLDAVYKEIIANTLSSIKINLLGFSQGAATVSRWVAQSNFDFEKLVLWGGALPPDLNLEQIYKRMQTKTLIQVIGTEDIYINSSKVEEVKALLKNYQLSAKFISYKGGHDIDRKTLIELFNHV